MISYRTEIKPNKKQIREINKTIDACRTVYNKFLEVNKIIYENNKSFMSHTKFSVWYNNEFIPNNEDKKWTKEVNTKATKQAMANAENAYKRFWKNNNGFPKFKKKQNNGSYYLIERIHVERHRIKLPNLKWVKLKEKGYIPSSNIKSTTIIKDGNRYFVSVLVDEEHKTIFKPLQTEGIGLDLGLKDTLFTPKGVHITDLRKNKKLINLDKSLKRQQRKLTRKQRKSNNWFKQLLKVQRLYRKISNIKKDIKRKKVLEII
ncbi:transposase [Staphylococcus phage vB_SsapH-Golestan101-M]|nr:transposase [Staphylococcus phage vB_SsapH-Golestan101-M]